MKVFKYQISIRLYFSQICTRFLHAYYIHAQIWGKKSDKILLQIMIHKVGNIYARTYLHTYKLELKAYWKGFRPNFN